MQEIISLALVATLGTWLVTALGAATVFFFSSPSRRVLNLMLGFAAGVMIAASFWSLLQPAIERAEAADGLPAYIVATAGFLSGALFIWLSDKIVARTKLGVGAMSAGGRLKFRRIILHKDIATSNSFIKALTLTCYTSTKNIGFSNFFIGFLFTYFIL